MTAQVIKLEEYFIKDELYHEVINDEIDIFEGSPLTNASHTAHGAYGLW